MVKDFLDRVVKLDPIRNGVDGLVYDLGVEVAGAVELDVGGLE